MFTAELHGERTYSGINIRTNIMILSQEFCDRFVKDNNFVALSWDIKTRLLSLTFYPTDSETQFRAFITKHPNRSTRISNAKFFAHLRPFKHGRYPIIDVDISKSNVLTIKVKLEK